VTASAASWTSTHAVHLLTVGVPTVLMLAIALGAELRARVSRRPTTHVRPPWALTVGAAVCSLVATAVHVRVAPEHFHEAIAFGVFFVVTATAQLGWAAWVVVKPRRVLLWAGLAGNFGVVALWLFTRTVAVPIGPDAGSTEEIGGLDIVATSAEVALLVLVGMALVVSRRRAAALRSADPVVGAVDALVAAEGVEGEQARVGVVVEHDAQALQVAGPVAGGLHPQP